MLFADKYETVEVCEGEATKWFMETEGAHRVREYREWFGKNPSMDAMMRLYFFLYPEAAKRTRTLLYVFVLLIIDAYSC